MKKSMFLNNIIIPLFILAVCSLSSLLHENLTYIANVLPYRYLVFILACLISYNFYTQFSYIFIKTHFNKYKLSSFILYFTFLIPIAVLIPYSKKDILLSNLHVWISFGGSISFIILLHFFLWYLAKTQITLYQQILPIYIFIISGLFSLFIWLGSVNSLIEIFFIWTLNLLIYRLNRLLYDEY